MCKLFNEWESTIKNYCEENGLNFDKAKSMSKAWAPNRVALCYVDKTAGDEGLLDDTPSPLVLLITKKTDGEFVFEQTEHTKKYLA